MLCIFMRIRNLLSSEEIFPPEAQYFFDNLAIVRYLYKPFGIMYPNLVIAGFSICGQAVKWDINTKIVHCDSFGVESIAYLRYSGSLNQI